VLKSADRVTVHVVPIVSVEIEAPTTTLETNTSMPLYVLAKAFSDSIGSKLTPLSYGTASPALSFDWSSSNKQVATLGNYLDTNDIRTTGRNCGIVRVLAHRAGVTTISVTVSVTSSTTDANLMQIRDNSVLIAKLQLRVFDSLLLKSPLTSYARVLLSPGAEYSLATNKDAQSKMR